MRRCIEPAHHVQSGALRRPLRSAKALIVAVESAQDRAAELRQIGTRVQALRKAANLTQAELADAAGLHRVNVSRLEHGLVDIGVSRLRALARALKVDPSDLID